MSREMSEVGATSDADLVASVTNRDEEALADLYRRHGTAVWGLARRVTNDVQAAEEVTQTVFLELWAHADRFDPARGSLRSWLLAQTHGRAVDLLRSEISRRNREQRDAAATAEAGYDLEHEVVDLAVAEEVRVAMEILSPGERRAIELAYFGGRTYREVATLLDEPEGTVKSRIRTGLRRLRGALTDAGIGAP